MGNPDSAPANRYDGSRFEIRHVTLEDLLNHGDTGASRDVRQPDQPAMGFVLEEHQPPEVLVHGNEDPLLGCRSPKNLTISGIFAPFP